MTWQEFIEKGAQMARQLNGDPKIRMFIDEHEIDLESFHFKLIKENNKEYQLVLSN